MLTRSQQDASFYGAMHSLLSHPTSNWGDQSMRGGSLGPSRESSLLAERFLNRRNACREPFSCPQLIAPYDGRELPSQAKFQLAECHDISTSGFCFVADRIPDQQFLVIALGTVPFSFFAAEIVHVDRHENSSPERYRVGCRFVKRLGALRTA